MNNESRILMPRIVFDHGIQRLDPGGDTLLVLFVLTRGVFMGLGGLFMGLEGMATMAIPSKQTNTLAKPIHKQGLHHTYNMFGIYISYQYPRSIA